MRHERDHTLDTDGAIGLVQWERLIAVNGRVYGSDESAHLTVDGLYVSMSAFPAHTATTSSSGNA